VEGNPMDNDAMFTLLMLFLWVVFALIVAGFAEKRGRSFAGWLVVALLVSPLIAFFAVAVMEPGTGGAEHRTCPFCAERIKAEALVCCYCGRELPANEKHSPVPPIVSAPIVFPKEAIAVLTIVVCLILCFAINAAHESGQTFLGW
jgi:hypothetical protein